MVSPDLMSHAENSFLAFTNLSEFSSVGKSGMPPLFVILEIFLVLSNLKLCPHFTARILDDIKKDKFCFASWTS